MTTATINQLSNKDLSGILSNYVATSVTRPSLMYGYFNGEKMFATDATKFITLDKSLIEYLENETEKHLYDVNSNEKFEENYKYPEVERLGHIHENERFTINKKQLTSLHNTVKTIKAELKERYFGGVKLQFETVNNELVIKGYTNEKEGTESYNTGIKANNIEIILNAAFFVDMLVSFKKILKATGEKEINAIYNAKLRPIKFILPGELASILLMPIRKY